MIECSCTKPGECRRHSEENVAQLENAMLKAVDLITPPVKFYGNAFQILRASWRLSQGLPLEQQQ